MALPAQVRKQAEAVDKLYEELNADDTVDNTNDEGEASAADNEADGAGGDAAGSEPAEHTGEGAGGEEDDTLEQKYRTLQGMYNAEVPRLHAEKRELEARVTQLEELLASLADQQAQQPAEQPKLVTDQDLEEYGDSIDIMRKVSREEVAAQQARINELEQLVRQLQTSVVPQVQQLAQQQTVSSERHFWAELQAAVPDWQEINANPDFQSWLLEVDPLTGMPRQTHLDDAQRNMDTARVINFFTAWKGQAGSHSAQQNRSAQPAEQLERQISPGRGRSGGQAVAPDAKTYTPADIRKFFTDVQKGLYKGREAERDRIERDIFAAQQEGRIVQT